MSMTRTSASPRAALVIAAFGVIYVVWGSTYLAIRFAIETLPPFLMAGVRFVVAGLLLYAIAQRREPDRPSGANWLAATVVGCFMLVGGPGLVTWAEQLVPSGLTALLIATVPLWFVVLDWLLFRGPRPSRTVIIGVLTGMFGVYLLLGSPKLESGRVDPLGGGVLLLACFLWTIGSLHSRTAKLPRSPFVATAMEMTIAGAVLLVLGTVTGEWTVVHIDAITIKSVLALLYLISFGSILALTAYVWLLRVSTSAKVSTYAYVNPVIALVLGSVVGGEEMTPRAVIASVVILAAVLMITRQSASSRSGRDSSPSRASHGKRPLKAIGQSVLSRDALIDGHSAGPVPVTSEPILGNDANSSAPAPLVTCTDEERNT